MLDIGMSLLSHPPSVACRLLSVVEVIPGMLAKRVVRWGFELRRGSLGPDQGGLWSRRNPAKEVVTYGR